MNPLRSVQLKLLACAVVSLLVMLAISWRFGVVQILRHEEFAKKAAKGRTDTKVIKKERGRILDADGNLLVGNLPRVEVTCAPYGVVCEPFNHLKKSLKKGDRESIQRLQLERRREVAELLTEYFGRADIDYYKALKPLNQRRTGDGRWEWLPNRYLLVAPAATVEQCDAFKAELAKRKISAKSFTFLDFYTRHYPKGRMLANVLGYANVKAGNSSALAGLEVKLDRKLRSADEKMTYEHDVSGQSLGDGKESIIAKGSDGIDTYLTVREEIQSILEEELDAAMDEFNPQAIYAVIVDPRTGNILAISQRPNFDPGDRKTITNASLTLSLAANSYEPGSVMKPFTVGKALDWGVITPDTIIDCSVSPQGYRPLTDARVYGEMTPGGVLKKSSNIGTAKIALMLGEERAGNVFKTFKFGVRSGLPFPSESRGVVTLPQNPRRRDKNIITRAPIGYAVQVSILQLARAYCALANGGMMPELRLIDHYVDPDDKKIPVPAKPPVQTFENLNALKNLVEMLISVTAKDGTGRRAAIPGYEVAGKTGTSKKLVNGGYSEKFFCASFAGFVPARNPQFVMVLTFDGVSGPRHGGGNVAAPVFQKTMSRVLQLMNVPPDFPDQLDK